MGHSVGEAAKRSTEKGTAKAARAAITEEGAIREIRNLRASKLFVSNMEYVDMLLAAHDQEVLAATGAIAERAILAQEASTLRLEVEKLTAEVSRVREALGGIVDAVPTVAAAGL